MVIFGGARLCARRLSPSTRAFFASNFCCRFCFRELCLSSEEGGEAVVEEEGVELPELELEEEEEEELQEELSCEVLEWSV